MIRDQRTEVRGQISNKVPLKTLGLFFDEPQHVWRIFNELNRFQFVLNVEA